MEKHLLLMIKPSLVFLWQGVDEKSLIDVKGDITFEKIH